jgi:hypothetical protein
MASFRQVFQLAQTKYLERTDGCQINFPKVSLVLLLGQALVIFSTAWQFCRCIYHIWHRPKVDFRLSSFCLASNHPLNLRDGSYPLFACGCFQRCDLFGSDLYNTISFFCSSTLSPSLFRPTFHFESMESFKPFDHRMQRHLDFRENC